MFHTRPLCAGFYATSSAGRRISPSLRSVDPSALHPLALTVTHHGRAKITSAMGLAAFRHQISSEAWSDTIASFEEDFSDGRYIQSDILWRATLQRAVQLSREHTPTIGDR